jgi:hypothetical protein
VAERLLAAVAAGETLPGLEVAWHCIRARRPDEGTPFLMSGAREAITHGAPDEAARALATGVRHLKGRVRDEALLLLAETYQEMAEWKGALESVSELSPTFKEDSYLAELEQILETESRYHLDYYSTKELVPVIENLIAIGRGSPHPGIRVRAALAAATHAGGLRMPDLISRANEAVSGMALNLLSEADRSKVLTIQAFTHYHRREPGKGFAEVRAAANLLLDSRTANSHYVFINIGLGATACIIGDYTGALHSAEVAYAAAKRLDHVGHMGQAACNIALCNYRLGAIRESLNWGITAREISKRTPPGSYERIHSASLCGRSYAKLGDTKEAGQAMNWLRQDSRACKLPWTRQSADLFQADMAWLLGEKKLAFEYVREARDLCREPLAIGLTGQFGRWSTLYLLDIGQAAAAHRWLLRTYRQLDQFDAMDQAELLCSLLHLGRFVNIDTQDVAGQARTVLARLPTACAVELRELGLILSD